MRLTALKWTAIAFAVALAAPASGETCRNTENFDRWLGVFKQEAISKGISPQVIAAASPYMRFEPKIINRDRSQSVFNQSFLKFSDRMIAGYRMQNGMQQMQKHAALFRKIEQDFGVSTAMLTAFWGLESDFGKNTGNAHVLAAITTLAYDCRRPEYFREQLLDALRIIQRGDLRVEEMRGGEWAGELGALQFTASDYYKSAVDYDGDGRRDLINSTPDTIATGASFLKSLGWKRGEPWLQEVRVPRELQWDQADLTIQHPRSQWVAWGVRAAHGKLPGDGMKASLLLPMGRSGPAFLAYDNFHVLLGWNSSMVYVTTVAYFGTRLAGAPPVDRGDPNIEVLSTDEVKELQTLLNQRGIDVGEVDGKVGAMTRAGVKKAQMQTGLPPDSYPTAELIARLRRSGG